MLGKLIVFEGIEGSGKSTQAELLREYIAANDIPATLAREPGGTSLGEAVREILLDSEAPNVSPRAELFLYLAARAQLVREIVGPRLEAGERVILDRYVHSTVAYQGYGLRVDIAGPDATKNVAAITELCRRGVGGFWPDIVFLLDLPVEIGLGRLTGLPDRIEKRDKAFHNRVREGYLTLANVEKEIFRVVDAAETVEIVAAAVRAEIVLPENDRRKTAAKGNR